jgi:hypothetical protein
MFDEVMFEWGAEMKQLFTLTVFLLAVGALSAQQPAIINGQIVGSNGGPMHQAHLQLFRPNQITPIATVQADADGGFHMSTEEQGLMLLKFSGVYHQMLEVPVLLSRGDNVNLDVQLKALTYPPTLDSVRIIGDFNSFSYTSADSMEQREDSTYMIRFSTTASEMAYQILIGRMAIPGTDADDFVFDGKGGYRAVVKNTDDQIRVIFDPRLLIRSNTEAIVQWQDTNRVKFAGILTDIYNRRRLYEEALKKHREAGGTFASFSYDWSKVLKQLAGRINRESDSLTRQALLLGYLDLSTCDATKQLDQKMIRMALDSIPPGSALWAINPRLIPLAVERAADTTKYADYTQQVIEQNIDPIVQAVLLYDGLVIAHRNNKADIARQYYNRLMTEFGNTPYAGMARVEFAMN